MGIKGSFIKNISVFKGHTSHFSLRQYFTLYSIVFFVFLSIVFGIVFIAHEKSLLINYAISSAEEFTRQLSNRVQDAYIVSELEANNGSGIMKGSPDYEKLDRNITGYISEFSDILQIKIFNRNGMAIYATDPGNAGIKNTDDKLKQALNGHIVSELTKYPRTADGEETDSGKKYDVDILEIYIPIYAGNDSMTSPGNIVGAFEVYKDVSKIFNTAKTGGYTIFTLFALSMGVLFFIWQMIIKKADSIIGMKNAEIKKYNTELEEAQQKITESIDEVIAHGSFHVRYYNDHIKLLKCWEFKNCTKTNCPGYMSEDLRCWQTAGTFCGGMVQGQFALKFGDCRKCEVYQHAFNDRITIIGESFNNMMVLLQNKHKELQDLNERLNILVHIDPLTQISNRRSFQERIENVHLHSLRYNHPYSIIICDIDNFKLYNDTYGHQQGDYVLISVTNTMKASLRRSDEIFRWGGEEFIVILPEQNHADALKVAEYLRTSVYSLGIEHRKSDLRIVTVSCGVASFNQTKANELSWEFVVKQADDALYKAKLNRKNCVYSAIID